MASEEEPAVARIKRAVIITQPRTSPWKVPRVHASWDSHLRMKSSASLSRPAHAALSFSTQPSRVVLIAPRLPVTSWYAVLATSSIMSATPWNRSAMAFHG
jgi:hypothetical protein